ncbi:MAG TPA: glucosaminidase domain-containing protein [Arenibacter sp.]|nr:glucosaminidase domain-containing protein [Arenibacter sp.]
MIKRLVFILIMGSLAIGCGTKKRTTYAKKPTGKPAQSSVDRKTEAVPDNQGTALFPLPEDTGDFVKFPIASVEEYIAVFAEIAQFEMKAYGIPASITLAQGILESGAGRSDLCQRTNNHFGIKCHVGWEGDYDHHDDDEKGECFRKYNHPMYSFRDHSLFLTTRARYSFLFDLDHDDYEGWAKGLKQAGYATDKKYPAKLISFIERYGLDEYDKEVLRSGTLAKKTPKEYDYRVHVVQKGDTLYSISRKYFVSVPELMKINNMKNSNLAIGQKLTVKSEKMK